MNTKKDFPLLMAHPEIVYLDSAASTQKPQCVLDAMNDFYLNNYANVHRGIYGLGARATTAYENARETLANFIHAEPHETIFTRGTTESINLVAYSYLVPILKPGDEVLISAMEHHANIVPWQVACQQTGAILKVIPISDAGELDLIAFENLLSVKTKLLALTHVSNVLGTINPVQELITQAHSKNIPVLIDGAQGIMHEVVDVKKLDCDFYVFSSHKLFGPTGVGILYAKENILKKMRPYQTGGEMIRTVSFEKTEFAEAPQKFEAGTPSFVEVVGFAAAVRYLQSLDFEERRAHDQKLLAYATHALKALPGITIFGNAKNKAGIISFTVEGVHPHDIATILDSEQIAVRAGHHCAMPLMQRFNVPAMARASFSIYNSEADVDVFVRGLEKVKKVFYR